MPEEHQQCVNTGTVSGNRPSVLERARQLFEEQRETPSIAILRALGASPANREEITQEAQKGNAAKPAVRAKLPLVVIGRTTGTLVTRLKASSEMMNTGRHHLNILVYEWRTDA